MFSSVPMTQINVASPVSKLDDVLSVMEKLGCIHINLIPIRRWSGIGQARLAKRQRKALY